MKRCGDMTTTRLTIWLIGIGVLVPASAQAQWTASADSGFVAISGGGQFTDRQLATSFTVTKFDETGTLEVERSSGSGGLFDLAAGMRVVGNLAVGLAFSVFETTEDISGRGTVPSPLFFDRPRSVTFEATGLKRRELGIHVSAVYLYPVSDRILVSFFGGPSVFQLRQGLVRDIELGPETDAPLFESVDVSSVVIDSVRNWGIGGHAGVEGTFLLTSQLGVSGFFRFAAGAVDLTSGDTSRSVDVGGAQLGGGLKLFF